MISLDKNMNFYNDKPKLKTIRRANRLKRMMFKK